MSLSDPFPTVFECAVGRRVHFRWKVVAEEKDT
jgi:hypothetical protein